MPVGSPWLRETLEKIGTPASAQILADDRRLTKLDRILEGLTSDRRSELLRLVLNLGIDPDDPAWVIAVGVGAIAKLGEEVPTRVEALIERVEKAVEEYDMNDTAAAKARMAQFESFNERLTGKAVELAEAAMRSQFNEEEAKNRLRLTMSIDAMIKDYRGKLIAERSKFSLEQTRSLGVASVIVAAVLALGLWLGTSLGYERATASGAVSDEVYRLELLGAGWESYRGTLSAADRASADAYIGHHKVFVPNPRGR
jgi:hypothetical protein